MSPGKVWTGANWLMAALFTFSLIVQFNDPDPLRWMVVYACAAVVCVLESRRATPWPASAIVLVLALVAAAWIARDLDASPVGRLFDEWEMRDTSVEETREVGGLLIVAAWMAVVTVSAWLRSRARRLRSTSSHEPTLRG